MTYNYIPEHIRKLPLSIVQRLRLERLYHKVVKPINKMLGRHKEDNVKIFFEPLVHSNQLYGNEYMLRCYAGIREDLFAIIEHGLFFGNNKNKIPYEHEWELGCILTYGEYRKKLIKQVFPDYYCEAIGAPILYADSEEKYRLEIKNDLQISGKTLLFFPAHGIDIVTPKYSINVISDQLLSSAIKNCCFNIILCSYSLSPCNELYQSLINKSNDIKIYIYSCGSRFDQEFLLRQRALISLSTITASNSLGTHVGNCVGLQKPHMILKQEITYEGDVKKEFGEQTRSANWKDQFTMENNLFEKMFPYNSGQLTLTQDQYNFCDYYWGFSKKKTPEEIREIYKKCHEYALEFIVSKKEGIVP